MKVIYVEDDGILSEKFPNCWVGLGLHMRALEPGGSCVCVLQMFHGWRKVSVDIQRSGQVCVEPGHVSHHE